MSKVKGGTKTKRRHNAVLKVARGFRGARSKLFRTAVESYHRSLAYAYRDRRQRKRQFRRLWISRINAAARMHGIKYSELMNLIKRAGIEIDRKVLAYLALEDSAAFAQIVKTAQKAAGSKA